MFSKACIYAIQATIYLAQQGREKDGKPYTPVAEIAQALGIPYQFLKKIIQTLAEKGLLLTQRSAKGGVALARSANTMTVLDVIAAIDGVEMFTTECILKFPGCGNEKPCPMHNHWAVERVRLQKMFEQTNLEEVAVNVSKGLIRLGMTEITAT
jgi:Rrf2 family transcriptional regulator, iron-sulfur cluster assembly transcription factor